MPRIYTPKAKFDQHRRGAAERGIAFKMTFAEWWGLWEPHWERRGKGSQDMCMCRTRDEGAYEVGNVRIATNKENAQEAAVAKLVRRASRGRTYRPREARVNITNAQYWMARGDMNQAAGEDEENA